MSSRARLFCSSPPSVCGPSEPDTVPVAPNDVDWGLASEEDLAQTCVQPATASTSALSPSESESKKEREVLHAALSADVAAAGVPPPHMHGWQLVDLEDDFTGLATEAEERNMDMPGDRPGEAAAMVSVEVEA